MAADYNVYSLVHVSEHDINALVEKHVMENKKIWNKSLLSISRSASLTILKSVTYFENSIC